MCDLDQFSEIQSHIDTVNIFKSCEKLMHVNSILPDSARDSVTNELPRPLIHSNMY